MRKIIERLLVFFIGVPAVFAAIYLLPGYHHLLWNIIIIGFSAIGAVEFSTMMEKKNIKIFKIEAFLLGSLAPLAAALVISFNMPEIIIPKIIMAGFLWSLLSQIFAKAEKLDTVTNRIIGCLSVMIYPGFFLYWLVKMSRWDNSASIFLFLLIVFFNDSAAWLFGSLFGKNNRGLIPASPNKSIVGFIGGMAGSILICVLAVILFPSIFPNDKMVLIILLGFFTSIFATLGDLAESAIKRSCDFKDSGNIMLGRGGILDSIDSIAIAAPVFYLLYSYIFCI